MLIALVPAPSTARAGSEGYPYAGSIPERTGVEFNQLFSDSLESLPGLREVSKSHLNIFGNSRDDLIYDVQFTRGYQLRPEAIRSRLIGSGIRAMQPEMARAWSALRAEASRHGWSLSITSAFRSVDVQRSIARRRYRHAGTWSEVNAVAKWHSVPGTSKHHTGYTLDIGYAGRKLQSHDAPYKWLSGDNYAAAKSYGFIPSYPPDGGRQGPNHEPWEWNWVGIDN
ncbi:MAG TPA: D-alanyl-D-alanine carboxypeptidase family protein, partial [Acidimicrobiia bacterium]|nr:D-alanyl-D-alanine carboxypeptidase family protein [Acidimicrobiia bacterium]